MNACRWDYVKLNNYDNGNPILAIIFACFNRIDKTKKCIESLQKQLGKSPIQWKFYICDDNSTDGTFEMLHDKLPEAKIIRTKGNYYWSRSMYVAMKEAQKDNPDYYLMINDDMVFCEDAIKIMLSSYQMVNSYPCGVVGTTISAENGDITYGGRTDDTAEIIIPSNPLSLCRVANWNCFLIDSETVNRIGIIDGKYAHAGGDYDYCYRMNKAGIPIYVAYDIVGSCEANNVSEIFLSTDYTRRERLRAYFSRKGMPLVSTVRYQYKSKGVKGLWIAGVGYIYGIFMIMMKKDLTGENK